MNIWQVLFLVIGFLIAFLLLRTQSRLVKLRKKKFEKRPVIDFDSWMEQNGYQQTEIFRNAARCVLESIAEALEIQPTQLKSTDRFSQELSLGGFGFVLGDETYEELEDELNDRIGIQVNFDGHYQSIDDVIRKVSSELSRLRS